MEIRTVALDDPLVAPLLAGLEQEYEERYGPGGEMATTGPRQFDPPEGRFLVVVADGAVVAGGGFRRVDDGVCEVKRMWTRADRRRRGLATVVLEALEEAARDAGYTSLRLETGPAQPEAIEMYTGRGYHRIPVYGPYEQALAFERTLR